MSKSTHKQGRKKSAGRSGLESRRPAASDPSIYGALLIIGVAVVLGAFLLSEGDRAVWGAVATGYVAAVAWLTILYALHAWKGRTVAGWKASLARIPLRFAGYGRKHGKPLAAAHDSPGAKQAIVVGAIVGAVIVVACAALLLPGIV